MNYQNLVWSSYFGKSTLTRKEQLINNIFGLIGEVGEVSDLVKKQVYLYRPIDREHFKDELGDVIWHLTCLACINGISLQEIMEYSIKKTMKRYPEADWKEDESWKLNNGQAEDSEK